MAIFPSGFKKEALSNVLLLTAVATLFACGLTNFEKCEVRFLLAYVVSKDDNGKDIGDLNIYSKTEFRKFMKES